MFDEMAAQDAQSGSSVQKTVLRINLVRDTQALIVDRGRSIRPMRALEVSALIRIAELHDKPPNQTGHPWNCTLAMSLTGLCSMPLR